MYGIYFVYARTIILILFNRSTIFFFYNNIHVRQQMCVCGKNKRKLPFSNFIVFILPGFLIVL